MANQASKSLDDRPTIASPTHAGPSDQKRSPIPNELDGPNAKRPRLSTDTKPIIRPTLSSSYRPTNRPLIDRMGLTSPALSSSTSSTFPTENIVTPTFSSGPDIHSSSSSSNSTLKPNTVPQSSKPSSDPKSLSSRLSDLQSSLPPPPSVHPLPARPLPLFTPPATNPDNTSPVASLDPTTSKWIPPTSKAINNEADRPAAVRDGSDIEKCTTVKEPVESTSIEEIRRRADEVIARLTGSNPLSPHDTTPTTALPPHSGRAEESIHQKAEDVIARLEREARAREGPISPSVYRPPPQVFQPGPTPSRPPQYPMGMGMRPPPGWRLPVGLRPPPPPPPPGWRPPMGFRPPSAPPSQGWGPAPPSATYHSSPPRPPMPALNVPLRPSTTSQSPSTSTSLAPHSPKAEAEAEEAVLLPRQKGSSKAPETTRTPNPLNQVYIGNLPQTTQLATLRKAFESLSPILTIELRAPFAMIEFAVDGMAERAVDVYDEGTFGGVQIRVERAAE